MYYLDNFKSFTNAEFDLSECLTILIGPNGSGKTNLIEAIELLSFIAKGGLAHNITELGRGGQLEVRGGLPFCARYGHNTFSLGFDQLDFSYSVTVQTKPIPQIVKEKLFDQTTLFETVANDHNAKSGQILVKYNDKEGIEDTKYVSSHQSFLSQYNHLADIKKPWEYELQAFDSPFLFDPNPKLMRQYEQIGSHTLTKNGANLSAVLYDMSCMPKEYGDSLERLLNWIKQLPNEPYQDFDFDVTKYNSVMFGLMKDNEGNSIGANLLSDGTLRSLAILTLLERGLDVYANQPIIIEEFDNGLHPSRIKELIEAIDDCCQRMSIKVMVTTHNPATLNALTPKQLEGVVLCTGDKFIKLYDLPRYPELLESGQLGDLVTSRVIDQYLAHNFEEERQTEALEWLKNLP
jgi:predicted ATPase